MEKPQASDLMKEGTVMLFRNKSPFGRGISVYNNLTFQRGAPTHATIVSHLDDENVHTYEMAQDKITLKPRKLEAFDFEENPKGNVWIGNIGNSYLHEKPLAGCFDERFLEDKCYSWRDVLTTPLGRLLGTKQDFSDRPGSVTCGGLIVYLLSELTGREVDLAEELRMKPNYITPNHFRNSGHFPSWKQCSFDPSK